MLHPEPFNSSRKHLISALIVRELIPNKLAKSFDVKLLLALYSNCRIFFSLGIIINFPSIPQITYNVKLKIYYSGLVKYIEIPCPPPMHMDIIASFLLDLLSSYITLTVSTVPVAPIGCPIEMPPP